MWWKTIKQTGLPCSFLILVFAGFAAVSAPDAQAARANLPTANEVTPGKPMRVDGEYRISTINKRILLERGRAIALEGWKHFLFWDIEPGMVVISDIRYVGNGRLKGNDLPLNGEWRAKYNRNTGKLRVVVDGATGKVNYDLIPVSGTSDYEEEPPEPVVLRVKAERMGNAVLPLVSSCPGKQSYLSRGGCWVCPNGYKRAKLTREMDHPQACVKRGSWGKGPFRGAKRKNIAGARCPSGQFHIAEKGVNGCYSCPTGYVRDNSTRNSAMCMSRQG